MRRARVGVEQADGHRLDLGVLKPPDQVRDLVGSDGRQDPAGDVQPFSDLEAEVPGDEGRLPGRFPELVDIVPRLPGDLEEMAFTQRLILLTEYSIGFTATSESFIAACEALTVSEPTL